MRSTETDRECTRLTAVKSGWNSELRKSKAKCVDRSRAAYYNHQPDINGSEEKRHRKRGLHKEGQP